jgi:hypothetical protein
MLRSALSLSVALAVLCIASEASAARTTFQVSGDVLALAFAGDALAIAHRPPGKGLTVERFAAGGGAPQPLLNTTLTGDGDQVALAGSAQAVAIGVQPDGGDSFGASRAFIGPATGPLREVAVCTAGLLAPPVAVLGARIAWRDGACGEPAESPLRVSAAALMIGAADPAIAPRRIVLEPDVMPVSIVLADDGGLLGVLRPSFFAVDSEVRAFGPAGVGAPLLAEDGRIVTPLGVLPDGTRVFSLAKLELGEEESQTTCQTALFTIAAGATQRRELDAGGCPLGAAVPSGPAGLRVAGDRVYAIVSPLPAPRDDRRPLVSLVSVRSDGSDRRVHAQGSHRPPLGLAADGDRAAFWHRRCTAGSSDVIAIDGAQQDAGPTAIDSCRAEVLTHRARVHDGRVAVRLRCPSGCAGVAFAADRDLPRRLRAFSFERGAHTLRLTLAKAIRRSGTLHLELAVESGPGRSAVVRLRR